MKSVSGKELAKLVQTRGWTLLRIHGSHHVYGKSGNPKRLVIPVHGNQPLKRGLQAALMKMVGLTEADL